MIAFQTDDFLAGVKEAVGKMSEAVGESTLRQTGFAGAAIFREEAKRNAASHVKTGILYRNIIVKRLEEDSDTNSRQAYLVTVRAGKMNQEGDAFYWKWVERGHKFVPRNPKQGKGADWKAHRAAAALEYGTASVPAYPFMRPAFDSKQSEAIEKMKETLAAAIKKSLA